MARYADGFVIALPTKKLGAYRKMARLGAKIWKEHGALGYYECVGEDLKAQYGMMPFPKLARLKRGETVAFPWIVYRSKKHRNNVNALARSSTGDQPSAHRNRPGTVARCVTRNSAAAARKRTRRIDFRPEGSRRRPTT